MAISALQGTPPTNPETYFLNFLLADEGIVQQPPFFAMNAGPSCLNPNLLIIAFA